MSSWYFDDLEPGARFETRAKTLSEAEILDFAFRYDPQPFHIDVGYAEAGPFGGLVASGVHTMAIGLRMILQAQVFAPDASMGSPGLDEVRWLKPVRPGDTLRARGEVLEARASRSKPDRGVMRYRVEVLNQRDETVMTMINLQILRRARGAGRGGGRMMRPAPLLQRLGAAPSRTVNAPPDARAVWLLVLALPAVSGALLLGAYLFQHLGGLAPCPLCLVQRYPHFAVLGLGLAAAVASGRARFGLVALCGIAFLVTTGYGAYHVGVEQGWFASGCASPLAGGESTDIEDIRARIMAAPLTRCDEVPFSLVGVSLAGWNAIVSFMAALGCLYGAGRLWRRRS